MLGRLHAPLLLRRSLAAGVGSCWSSSAAKGILPRGVALQPLSLSQATTRSTQRLFMQSSVPFSAQPERIQDTAQEQKPSSDPSYEEAKPFEAIPSPKRIPLLGFSYDFLNFSPSKIDKLVQERIRQCGMLYREKFSPGLPEFLFVLDPEDVAKVFRADGRHPMRFPITEWTDVRKELNIPLGLFLANGEEWESQRKPMSKFMMVPRKLGEYHETFNEVALDLVDLIRQERGEREIFSDVMNLMNRWSFESVCVFVLGKRLGCLEKEIPPDCQVYIDGLHNFLDASQRLLFGFPFHKFVTTKDWRDLACSQKQVYDIAMEHVKEKVAQVTEEEKRLLEEGEEDAEPPVGVDFITYMIHAGKMDLETIVTNSFDLMSAGVDTTSSTLAWTLYCLAMNPEVQEKLRAEVQEVVGSAKLVTPEHIAKMPYLHDCIRETQRLYPIAPNNSRIPKENIVLSGYKVPAGTYIIMPIRVAGALPENFPEPEVFKPERWSRKNKDTPNVFASLPFGFGVRMCVGRRVAELELHIALAQVMKNFRVEYRETEPLNVTQRIFVYPERQMDLAFVDLK